MSSNIGQNYPYTSETEAQRASAVERALEAFDGLRDRVSSESTPLPDEGRHDRWWVWVCPADEFKGRLHVAGYTVDRHGVYTVCDTCGKSFKR